MPQVFNRRETQQFPGDTPAETATTRGDCQPTDLIPEIENAVIRFVEEAEQISVRFQLHVPPARVMILIDRPVFQQVLSYCLSSMLSSTNKGATINLYVSDGEEKCTVELVTHGEGSAAEVPEDYFKKYRITNTRTPGHNDAGNYKTMMDEMGAELNFARPGYIRMKFVVCGL